MSNAIQFRMSAGIPGDINRAQAATVEAQTFNSAKPFTAYGRFAKIVGSNIEPLEAGDAATVIKGLLVRPFPTGASQDALGTSSPPSSGIGDLLRRGYMTVKLNQGASAKGGQVYVRTTAASGKLVGDIETTADTGNCVAVTGCFFTGAADANGNVEVEYNL